MSKKEVEVGGSEKSKEVTGGKVFPINNEQKKLSYDELEALAAQLSNRVDQLSNALNSIDGIFKRLDYLTLLLSLSDKGIFSKEIIKEWSEEVVSLMSVPEDVIEE